MKRGKTGEPGRLGRAEALGAIIVISLYIFSMLASYRVDSELFMTQLFYFTLITFVLVVTIFAFDRTTLECARISKYVVAGCVGSAVAMFALVNFIVLKPSILQIAALSSVTPTAGLALYQVLFVGVGEGLLHFTFINLSRDVMRTEGWGLPILSGSIILALLHIFAVGFVPLTLVFLGLIFVVIAGFSMTPALLGGKVAFSIIISAVVHMVYNVCLITMSGAVKATASAAVAAVGV